MTPTELIDCLDAIGWNEAQLARELDAGRDIVNKWTRGLVTVPPEVCPWLRSLAEAHRVLPAPIAWRRRPA